MNPIQPWQTIQFKTLFSSKWMSLQQQTIQLPSNRIIDDYFTIHIPDGAAIVAITEKKELVMVKQYKHGAGQVVLELPAGIVEEGEDPAKTILRELEEETGYVAKKVDFLAKIASKPARMAAFTHIYFADDLNHSTIPQDNDAEVIKTVLLPLTKLPEIIQKREIISETTLAALMIGWQKISCLM